MSHTSQVTINPPSPQYIPAAHSGAAQVPGLVVMHSTVTPTTTGMARSVANFFHTETNPTSAHYTVDQSTEYQCVKDHVEAYHCGYNINSIGIEMCDNPNLSVISHWFKPGTSNVVQHEAFPPLKVLDPPHHQMLGRAARLTARLCLAYGIPIRRLTDDQLRDWALNGHHAKDGGIVTHQQMTRVFRRSTHWDPGMWPYQLFMQRVRVAEKNLLKAAA